MIGKLWALRGGAGLLCVDAFMRVCIASGFTLAAVGSCDRVVTAVSVIGAAWTLGTLSIKLWPLAQINSLCQSRYVSDRSILRLAEWSLSQRHRMGTTAKAEQMCF